MIVSPLLPSFCGYIGGQWRGTESDGTIHVHNPATGEQLAEVPDMGAAETTAAVEAARTAMQSGSSLAQRREWLEAIARLMVDSKSELARIVTLEQGKPLKEAQAEVEYAAGFFRFFAAQIERLEPHTLAETPKNCQWTVHHRPAGVAALITPWNFPLAMLCKKFPAALAGGCASVAKPASQTPLSVIALAALTQRAGLPAGWFNVVIGRSGPIGEVLCTHREVRVVSFTGSTSVGKQLATQSAPHLKRLSLELGGNAPLIVFDDAEIESAADGLMTSKFRAAGQTCVCANRVYVHAAIEESFLRAVQTRVEALKVGNGLENGTDIGPLINRDAWDKVHTHVRDALERGARKITGGEPQRPDQPWGCFYPPTLLADVIEEMLVCREETFGPVVAVSRFDDEQAVVEAANGTPFGLAAYLFTRDRPRADRVIAALKFGHVGLNTGTGPTPEAPFGGMKDSGYGREGGVEGLFEFTEAQVIADAI
ncbi:MAG: NAD-dependent succinate-semialdehyde dehydrogenase [Phycisphaerae bacterium]